MGHGLHRLLAGQQQEHRHVVRPQAPERVLIGAQLPQVQAIAVDVVDLSKVAAVSQVLERLDPGVVLQQMPDHQQSPGLLGRLHRALGIGHRLSQRLLHETVLAGLQDRRGQRGMRGNRRGQDDRVELGIFQQHPEIARRRHTGEPDRRPRPCLLGFVTAPRELAARQFGEVACQVRPPVAEPDHSDANGSGGHPGAGVYPPYRSCYPKRRTSASSTRRPAWPSP